VQTCIQTNIHTAVSEDVIIIIVHFCCVRILLTQSTNTFHNRHVVYYLRQVNGVNGRDTVFVRCVCVCAQRPVMHGRSWELNANSSKTVKATDFKFDTRVTRDSPDVIPKNFPKRGRGHGHVTL